MSNVIPSRILSSRQDIDSKEILKMSEKKYTYDVALSFAGEDRSYAESLASVLQGREIRCFYDANETSKLWGKDGCKYLFNVFRHKAQYCVMFLSENYAKKRWTTHECKAAQARAINEIHEYILPIRLDKTEIEGINPNVIYLDWHVESVDSIANVLIDKLGKQSDLPKFYWDYSFNPEPGRRHWYQLDKDRWIEQYPGGHTTTFVVVDKLTKNNSKGVLVKKFNGAYEKTGVPDFEMEVFIPDHESGDSRLCFRHKTSKGWQNWKLAGFITYII